MLDYGHPVIFNESVGDTDENGNRVDRQFRYYPTAEPKPVLVTDGGGGASEAAMQEESIAYGEDGIAFTEDTENELLKFYWQATAKHRAHHDAVARGEKEPYNTPDGNPPQPPPGAEEELPPPNMNNHFTQEGMPGRPEQGFDAPPTREPPTMGVPVVEIDVPTFTEMQRQLIVAETQPLLDLQDMVIQTQAILLADALDPGSPHHQIMETWMGKLEEMRLKLYGRADVETEAG